MAGNGNSGRKRKPTALHLLEGTFRKDRMGDRLTGPQCEGEPTKPRLPEKASRHWDAVVPQLIASGVAKSIDGPALAALCRWWALWDDAMHTLEAHGASGDRAGAVACWKEYAALAGRFGLNPSDRAKLHVKSETKTQGVAVRVRS